MTQRNKLREAYQVGGADETRSFEELYGDSKLFEGSEDLINPKFRKLFESVYDEAGNPKNLKKLRENEDMTRSPESDSTEGIPASLNSSEIGNGPSSDITQSGKDYNTGYGAEGGSGGGGEIFKESLVDQFLKGQSLREEEEKKEEDDGSDDDWKGESEE